MKSNYHIFYESLIRASAVAIANDSAHFDRLLREGRMSLLLEAFTNEDATALADALDQQKKTTDEVAKALPESMKNVKDLLKKLSDELSGVSNTSEIVQMSIKGDTKGLKEKLAKVNGVFMRVGNVTAAVVQTMIDAAENLEVLDLSGEQLNMTLAKWDNALKKTTGEEKKGYEEVKKILKAVIDSFGVPDWQKRAVEQGSAAAQKEAGGLWGAVKGFLGKIFGNSFVENAVVEGRGAFTKDLQAMSIADIVNAKDNMTKAKTALEGTSKSAAQQNAEATADSASSSEGEGADAGSQQGGTPAANAQAAEAGIQSAAADASKQPLGKSVLDIIRGFAEPYKDNMAVKTSLDNLVGPTRQLLGDTEDQLRDALIAKWDEWNESLPADAVGAIYGDPEAEGYEKKKDEMDNAVEAAIQKVVADNLKFESRRRVSISKENIISESRWSQLAGLKETKRR